MDELKPETVKLSGPIELINKSFEIFFRKNNLKNFLKIYALLTPFSILSQLLNIQNIQDQIKKEPSLILIILAVGLIYLIVSFWVYVAGIMAVDSVVNGKTDLNLKKLKDDSYKKLWGFSLVGLLVGLVIMGGILLLFIPGLIFTVWYYFAGYAYVDKKLDIKEALIFSKSIVRGRFWAVAGRLIVIGLLNSLASGLVSALPYVGALMVTLAGALFILPNYLLYKELAYTKTSVERA